MTRGRNGGWLEADWPLVFFTALAAVGAGLLLAPLAALASRRGLTAAAPLAWPAFTLLAAGLAASLAHLGRPPRAPLAGRNLGQSRLSAEVVLALAAAGAAATAIAWPSSRAASVASAASALLFLLSLGLVYALPGQHAWRGPAAAAPLATALPLAVLASAALDAAPTAAWRATTAALLAADLALFAWRARGLASMPFGHQAVHPSAFASRRILLALRVVLVTVLPLLLAIGGHPFAAAATLAAGIVVDRVGFYALAVRHTTEGEIEAIENVMES